MPILRWIVIFLMVHLSISAGIAQTVTSAPVGTVSTQNPSNPDSYAYSGGQIFNYTNSSWPNYFAPCYTFALNDTLFNAINGYNNQPSGGPCSGLTNLVYNTGNSNLAAGIIVYTGTTTIKYLNTSSSFVVNTTIPVRATIVFSQPVTYYTNNTFVIPVTGNFNYSVIYECFSPTNAQYTSGAGNQWVAAKTLFNNLITDPATSMCTQFTPGQFYTNSVNAITSGGSTYCSGTNINLTGGGSGSNVTFTWNGPNSFYSSGANAVISNASVSNSGLYIYTATNDLGCSDTAHVQITVNQAPVATAGGTAVICHTSTATVSGANAANGTISWTHNGSGTLTNATSLTPTYDPSPSDAGNTVVLTLTVTSNNACSPAIATATYNVIVQGTPIAIDGATTSGCSTSNIVITSATASFGTISWTHNGTGTLTNANTATPTYTPGPGDDGNTIILTLTVTSTNSCAPGTASAYHLINITPLPQAIAGGSATICENSSVTVSGATALYGTINWTHNGAGTLTNGNSLTPTYTPGSGDVGNIVALTMTVTSNNSCAPATATADFTVQVNGLPAINGGGSVSICSNSNYQVTGVTSQNGTIAWSHNGNGTFTNINTLTPTYTPSTADAGNAVVLTATVTSNNACAPLSATATIVLNIDHLPVSSCTGSATICQNGSFQVMTAGASYGTLIWTSNGAGVISNPSAINPTYSAAAADAGNIVTLTLTVTSNNACAPQSSSANFNIIVQKLPVAIAGGTTTVCTTDNAPIAGVTATNGNIVWTHNGQGNLTNSTSIGPTYHPSINDAGNTVILTLTVVSTNSCAPQSATANYFIIVDSLPLANAGGSGTTCINNMYTVNTASAINGTPTWTTTGLGTLGNITSINPTYTPDPSEAGSDVTLTLTVSSNNACAPALNSEQFILSIDSLPYAYTPQFDTICPGGIYMITGASAAFGTVSWTHNGGGTLTNTSSLNPVYNGVVSDAGNTILFQLTVTSNNSCSPQSATSIFQVFVENSSNAPVIILDSIHNTSCNGFVDGGVFVSIQNGTAPFNYTWLPNNENTQDIEGIGVGTYTLQVMDAYGCSATDNFNVKEPAVLEITGNTTPVDCIGTFGSIKTQVSGGTPNYTYSWSPSLDTTSEVSGLPAGIHTVVVIDSNGCSFTQSFLVDIVGNLNVIATPNNASINIGTPTSITVTGASEYVWSPSVDLNCDTCSTVICSPYDSHTYIVTGSTPNGCVGTDTVIISMYIDCSNLSLPSMFSPNDEGPVENNTFGLLGQYPCIDEYQLMIFNRWGELVFETIDYRIQWDGNYHGAPQNSGVYVYRLKIKTIEGNEIKKAGNITLVR